MGTCLYDDCKKKEWLRKRKLRLQQVRSQSRDVAREIRQRVQTEKMSFQAKCDKMHDQALSQWKHEQIIELERRYHEAMEKVGLGYKEANAQPDVKTLSGAEARRNQRVARERGRSAEMWQEEEKRVAFEKATAPLRRKQLTRDVEDIRAALVVQARDCEVIRQAGRDVLVEIPSLNNADFEPLKIPTMHSSGRSSYRPLKEAATASAQSSALRTYTDCNIEKASPTRSPSRFRRDSDPSSAKLPSPMKESSPSGLKRNSSPKASRKLQDVPKKSLYTDRLYSSKDVKEALPKVMSEPYQPFSKSECLPPGRTIARSPIKLSPIIRLDIPPMTTSRSELQPTSDKFTALTTGSANQINDESNEEQYSPVDGGMTLSEERLLAKYFNCSQSLQKRKVDAEGPCDGSKLSTTTVSAEEKKHVMSSKQKRSRLSKESEMIMAVDRALEEARLMRQEAGVTSTSDVDSETEETVLKVIVNVNCNSSNKPKESSSEQSALAEEKMAVTATKDNEVSGTIPVKPTTSNIATTVGESLNEDSDSVKEKQTIVNCCCIKQRPAVRKCVHHYVRVLHRSSTTEDLSTEMDVNTEDVEDLSSIDDEGEKTVISIHESEVPNVLADKKLGESGEISSSQTGWSSTVYLSPPSSKVPSKPIQINPKLDYYIRTLLGMTPSICGDPRCSVSCSCESSSSSSNSTTISSSSASSSNKENSVLSKGAESIQTSTAVDKYAAQSQQCEERINQIQQILDQVRKEAEKIQSSSSGGYQLSSGSSESKGQGTRENRGNATGRRSYESQVNEAGEDDSSRRLSDSAYNVIQVQEIHQRTSSPVHSESSMPDLIGDLMQRNLISGPFNWSHGQSLSSCGSGDETRTNRPQDLSTSVGIASPSKDLDEMLTKLGMDWAKGVIRRRPMSPDSSQ